MKSVSNVVAHREKPCTIFSFYVKDQNAVSKFKLRSWYKKDFLRNRVLDMQVLKFDYPLIVIGVYCFCVETSVLYIVVVFKSVYYLIQERI